LLILINPLLINFIDSYQLIKRFLEVIDTILILQHNLHQKTKNYTNEAFEN
jgi:hypothetical protein